MGNCDGGEVVSAAVGPPIPVTGNSLRCSAPAKKCRKVILFSDILTPFTGMNIPFDIVKGKGPIVFDPIRTAGNVEKVREFNPVESVPYVGEALTILRKEAYDERRNKSLDIG